MMMISLPGTRVAVKNTRVMIEMVYATRAGEHLHASQALLS